MDDQNLQFSISSLKHNARSITFIRSSLSFITGICSGILGLTGYYGFLFYGIASIFMSLMIFLIKFKSDSNQVSKCFQGGFQDMFTAEVLGNSLSFVLFWTLSYGIVHIYD